MFCFFFFPPFAPLCLSLSEFTSITADSMPSFFFFHQKWWRSLFPFRRYGGPFPPFFGSVLFACQSPLFSRSPDLPPSFCEVAHRFGHLFFFVERDTKRFPPSPGVVQAESSGPPPPNTETSNLALLPDRRKGFPDPSPSLVQTPLLPLRRPAFIHRRHDIGFRSRHRRAPTAHQILSSSRMPAFSWAHAEFHLKQTEKPSSLRSVQTFRIFFFSSASPDRNDRCPWSTRAHWSCLIEQEEAMSRLSPPLRKYRTGICFPFPPVPGFPSPSFKTHPDASLFLNEGIHRLLFNETSIEPPFLHIVVSPDFIFFLHGRALRSPF